MIGIELSSYPSRQNRPVPSSISAGIPFCQRGVCQTWKAAANPGRKSNPMLYVIVPDVSSFRIFRDAERNEKYYVTVVTSPEPHAIPGITVEQKYASD